ncbi:MAG: sugar ABC transporter substrate-binding protein, partial [bacterium]|nr:sugar ABC transporter substrate-binding protein [bacterium]
MKTHIAQLRRLGRAVLAGTAALIVLWSFVRVGTRPWRRARGRPEAIEITVLHWGGHLEDAVVEMLKRSFEAAHPGIRIRRINAEADYFAKLRTMMAAGEPPDVMFLNGSHVPTYARRGLLRSVEELAGGDELEADDFYPEALRAFRFDGTVAGRGPLWGLPASVTPLGFYYNRDLFDRAGVAYPTDDWTWDEFADKARAIGRTEGAWGAEFSLLPAMVRVLVWTEGLDLFSPELDRLRWDEPEVRRVLRRLRGWRFGDGRFGSGRMLVDARSQVASGRDHFLAGKVGMYGPAGRWLVPMLRQVDGFAWEFAQLPRGRVRANTMFVAAWCIAAGSDHPAAAWAVARHFASPAAQRANVATGLALPTLRSVAESPAFLDPEVRPQRDDLFLAALARARAMRWPVDSQIESFAERRFDEALRIGTATLDRSLAALAADWQA